MKAPKGLKSASYGAANLKPWAVKEFTLTMLPTSSNDLVTPVTMRDGRMRLVKTKEAAAFEFYAKLRFAQEMAGWAPLAGVPIALEAEFWLPHIGSDLTNRLKALEDAMTGIVWSDDCQIAKVACVKHLDYESHLEVVAAISVRVLPDTFDKAVRDALAKSKRAGGCT